MSRRVYFAFHYQDVIDFRANVVRNHWVTKLDRPSAGYYDASIWEEAKKQSELALKRLINAELERTSATCVLVGSETFERPWVRYEILKSFLRGNKILAVHINSVKGNDGRTKTLGRNPLTYLGVSFSVDGKIGTMYEWRGGQWEQYEKIDGKATYATSVGAEYRGKFFRLDQFFGIYDWTENNGYQNFVSWVA